MYLALHDPQGLESAMGHAIPWFRNSFLYFESTMESLMRKSSGENVHLKRRPTIIAGARMS